MKTGLLIKEVQPKGLAATLGLQAGDRILSINGEPVEDFLDWNFLAAGVYDYEPLKFEILRNGKISCVKVGAAPRGRPLRGNRSLREQAQGPAPTNWGLTFEETRFRHCGNKCIFCFVDQLPPASRKSLCFKDEDYRLSFWHGNYITLTNLREQDFERIFRQRLSPLYISVHTTNDKTRRLLLGNPKAPAILPLLQRLIKGRIALHTQIVICPGINDGEVLDKTLEDLSALVPGILSLAVIPVGLTKFRQSLYPLKRVTPHQAEKILKQLTPWQKKFKKEIDSPWVYGSDELYLLARKNIPRDAFYGDYPQIENGVGLLRSFWEEIKSFRKTVGAGLGVCPNNKIQKGRTPRSAPTKIILVTGELFAPHLKETVASLGIKGNTVKVVAVKNEYLGRQVTVAGLVAGKDILRTLDKGVLPYAPTKIIIPAVMLKADKEVFLDGLTLEELRRKLGLPVEVVPPTGSGLMEALIK